MARAQGAQEGALLAGGAQDARLGLQQLLEVPVQLRAQIQRTRRARPIGPLEAVQAPSSAAPDDARMVAKSSERFSVDTSC